MLWEAFGGNGALCHAEALFRHVMAASDLQHLTQVRALKLQAQDDAEVLTEFNDHLRVRVVAYRSADAGQTRDPPAFGSVGLAFPDENTECWRTMVERIAHDLAAAMTAFAFDHQALPGPDFDPNVYNVQVLAEFAAAVLPDA